MSDDPTTPQPAEQPPAAVDGLISRLAVIDQQPLDQRAAAFGIVHDELRSVLEGRG